MPPYTKTASATEPPSLVCIARAFTESRRKRGRGGEGEGGLESWAAAAGGSVGGDLVFVASFAAVRVRLWPD